MNSPSLYDELDQAIDNMRAGLIEDSDDTRNGGPEIADLMKVARDLAGMPRADFMSRLLVELEWQASGRAMVSAPGRVVDYSDCQTEFMPSLFGNSSGIYPFRGRNLAASAALHAVLFLLLGSGFVMVSSTARLVTNNGGTAVDIYTPKDAYRPHGGGGSGATAQTGASKGKAPRFARKQFAPPTIRPSESKIKMEDTVIGPPDLSVLKTKQEGNPLSTLLALSSGVGVRGIGSGDGTGDGSGHGPGRGPGSGGGSGEGYFFPGRGVTAPRAIYKPEPEYSDEARQVKFQGIVTLSVIVDVDGRTRHVKVVHSLGMGLDEKAVEAVRNWRFEPGMIEGHAVPTQVTVDVDFRLY